MGLAAVLVVAMFVHTPVPEILASGFLLILGFFFGQNSTRGNSSAGPNWPRGLQICLRPGQRS